METKEYKYDAFISYRHLEPDRSVARAVQSRLETYKPPKSVTESFTPWRLFLDETELPSASNLSEYIEDALASSEFLIVICSPKLVESMWCMREIDRFKELHGGCTDHIIAVIADGNPGDVIPTQLLHETFTRVNADGTEELIDRDIEPIAANVASDTAGERNKKLKKEFLRIAAILLGCEFNDLYDREKKRRTRRRLMIGGVAAALVTAIAIYSTSMLFVINRQKAELAEANGALTKSYDDLAQANNLLEESNDNLEAANSSLEAANHELWQENARSLTYLSQSLFDQGDYLAALESAYSAMPESGSGEHLLAETAKTITEELEPYSEVIFRPFSSVDIVDNISYMTMTGGGETLAVSYDDYVSFYRVSDGTLLNTLSVSDFKTEYGSAPYELDLRSPEKKITEPVALESYTGDLLIVDEYGNYVAWRKTEGMEGYDCSDNILVFCSYYVAMVDGRTGQVLWRSQMPDGEIIIDTKWTGSGIFAMNHTRLVRFDETTGAITGNWTLDTSVSGIEMAYNGIDVAGDTFYFIGHSAGTYTDDYRHCMARLGDGTIDDLVVLDRDEWTSAYTHEMICPDGYLVMMVPCDILGGLLDDLSVDFYNGDGTLRWTYGEAFSGNSVNMFSFYCKAENTNSELDVVLIIYNDMLKVLDAATGDILDSRKLPGRALEAYGYERGLTFVVTDNGKEVCISTRKTVPGSTATCCTIHQYLTELMKMEKCSYYGSTYASYYKNLQKVLFYRDIFHDYETNLDGLLSRTIYTAKDGKYLVAVQIPEKGRYSVVVQDTETMDVVSHDGYNYALNETRVFGGTLLVECSDKIDLYDLVSGEQIASVPIQGLSRYWINEAFDGDSILCCRYSLGSFYRIELDGTYEEFALESEEYADEIAALKKDFICIAPTGTADEAACFYDSNGVMIVDGQGVIKRAGRLEEGVIVKGAELIDGSLFVMCGSGELLMLDSSTLEVLKRCKINDFGVLKSSCRIHMEKLEKRNLYLVAFSTTSATTYGKTAQTCLIDADSFEVIAVFDGQASYGELRDRVYLYNYGRAVSYPFFEVGADK